MFSFSLSFTCSFSVVYYSQSSSTLELLNETFIRPTGVPDKLIAKIMLKVAVQCFGTGGTMLFTSTNQTKMLYVSER